MTLKGFIGDSTSGVIGGVVQPIVGFMFALAVFFFLWNVFMLITKNDQPEELAKFKSNVVWGVVAIGVMASVWALIAIVLSSTGLDTTQTIIIKTGL